MKSILLSTALLSGVCLAAPSETSMLGNYQLIEFQAAGQAQPLPDQRAITLNIARGGKLAGFAGCNQYRGTLSASPLAIKSVASTRMMCAEAEMQFERTYLAALEQVNVLERQGKERLVLKSDQQQLVFKMSNKPVEKVIWIGPEKQDCVAGVMKTQCLQYKTSATGQWLNFYGPIEGFEWEQGKSYKLKIRQEKIANPPADASSLKTSLVKVLSSQ